jgi:release factor glutamine methyltransferase
MSGECVPVHGETQGVEVPDIVAGMSAGRARRALANAFRLAGLDTPELDARVLVGHGLGVDQATLLAASQRPLSGYEADRLAALGARRLAREPVARITGSKEFWGLPIAVSPATLVPRPETETVVEQALSIVDREGGRVRALRLADLGTGSGSLLVALLTELPGAFGIGTDVSTAALATAQENARRLGCGERAGFVACDFASALTGPFDLVVANPPYVRSADIAALAPEVRDHDPRTALDGGPDGLDAYRAIAADAGRLLARGGHLVIEIGAGQADEVETLFLAHGFVVAACRADLAGQPRALHIISKSRS